jgi:hypothetical protein
VTNNVFNGNADVAVLVSNMNGTTCLNFRNNSATPITEVNGTAVYEFVQTSGTFNLAPLVNNVGSLVQSGTITPVPSCD